MRGNNTKACADCQIPLPLDAFGKLKKGGKVWYRSKCIKCSNTWGRYKITGREFYKMLEEQDYCCLICEEHINETTACIDHCHDDQSVRALLCNGCNSGIGYLKHDKEVAARAVEYLTKFT